MGCGLAAARVPDVPNWLLRQITRHGGRWYPKRPESPPSRPSENHSRRKIPKGNLVGHEYEYYVGSVACKLVNCRFCKTSLETPQERRAHNARTNCALNLRKWHAALKQRGYCAVCAKSTQNQKWGVPLCPECIEAWMFYPPIFGYSFVVRKSMEKEFLP